MMNKKQRLFSFLTVVFFLLTLSSPAAGLQIRLTGSGSSSCAGRVEIYHNNIWGTVCDNNWDLDDAKVVCRELGCGPALSAPRSAQFGGGTGQIWLDDVKCSGSESSLTECKNSEFKTHGCRHGEDAGVICSVPLLLVTSVFTVIGLLLILLVLLIVCLVRRKRRRSKKPETFILSQLNPPTEDDDDGEDYVNVDKMDLKKTIEEETEEEDDYLEPDDDDDHDYEEAGPEEIHTDSKDICITLESYRPAKKITEKKIWGVEEEEDDDYEEPEDDDEHDYEEAGPEEIHTDSKDICITLESYRPAKKITEKKIFGVEEEDDDYEEPEDKNYHDYEEEGPSDGYKGSRQDIFRAKDQRDNEIEDDNEESDDEDDYENINSPFWEKNFAISSENMKENEDIYQNL